MTYKKKNKVTHKEESTPKKGFTCMVKDRVNPIVSTKQMLVNNLKYLVKIEKGKENLKELRFLYLDTNMTTLPSPIMYLSDPDLFKTKSIEYIQSVLEKMEELDEIIKKRAKTDTRISELPEGEEAEYKYAFDPIVSYGELTRNFVLEQHEGDLEAAGKHIFDFTLKELLPEVLGRKFEDFYYISGSQMDNKNSVLHNHPLIYGVSTKHELIDFNPEKLVSRINKARVLLTLRNPELFDLHQEDISRAREYILRGQMNEFIGNESVMNYLEIKAEDIHQKFNNDELSLAQKRELFTPELQQKTFEELSRIFEENHRDKKALAAAYKANKIVLNYKRESGKKVRQTFLSNVYTTNFPIEEITNEELKKKLRKLVDFQILNDLYSSEISASARLEEVEMMLESHPCSTFEELKEQLKLIGFDIIGNVNNSGKINGISYVDTRNGHQEIKASLSEKFNLTYMSERFNLANHSDALKNEAAQVKNKRESQYAAKIAGRGNKKNFEKTSPEIFKRRKKYLPFRISAYESEKAFFQTIKKENSFCSLAKAEMVDNHAYSEKGKLLFTVRRDQNEITIAKDGRFTSTAAIRSSIQYLIAAGSTRIEITSGSTEDRAKIYHYARLQGLEVAGYTPTSEVKKAVAQEIKLKTIKLESSFINALDKFVIERDKSKQAGTEFKERLWVHTFQEYQIEIDPTAIRLNFLYAVSKGLKPTELINYNEARAMQELAELKVLASLRHGNNQVVNTYIAQLEAKSQTPVAKPLPAPTALPTLHPAQTHPVRPAIKPKD